MNGNQAASAILLGVLAVTCLVAPVCAAGHPGAFSADFFTLPKHLVIGLPFNASGFAHGGATPYSYAWTTSDLQSATGQTVTFTAPSTPGPFTINLTVTDNSTPAQTVLVSKTVPVNPPPPLQANIFVQSPKPPVIGQPFNVTGIAHGGTAPYSYAWTTSDSQSASGQTATFTAPSTPGPFTINLTVTDSGNPVQTITVTKTVTVNSPRPLKANIIVISPKPPVTGQSINVTASAHGGTAPYAYAWTTSDSQSATGLTATFTAPTTPGPFTINLTVTDSGNPVQTITVSKVIIIHPPHPLKANIFIISPKPPVTGQSFKVSASAHGGTVPYTYAWITSDSQSATGLTATFTAPTTPGVFTINLTVTDNGNPVQTITVTKTIMVNLPRPLTAHIIVLSPKPPVTGRAYNVSASAHGGSVPYSFAWTTSDSQSASGQKATFTMPPTPGSFTINLTVTDNGSPVQIVTVTKTIMVKSPPSSH